MHRLEKCTPLQLAKQSLGNSLLTVQTIRLPARKQLQALVPPCSILVLCSQRNRFRWSSVRRECIHFMMPSAAFTTLERFMLLTRLRPRPQPLPQLPLVEPSLSIGITGFHRCTFQFIGMTPLSGVSLIVLSTQSLVRSLILGLWQLVVLSSTPLPILVILFSMTHSIPPSSFGFKFLP